MHLALVMTGHPMSYGQSMFGGADMDVSKKASA